MVDFASMKRRELQALCKRHGLAGGGTNADLAARLAAALSGSGGAEEQAVGVVVGKGCLRRSGGGASGGGSDAAKKVTFVFEEEEEEEEEEEAEVGVRGRHRKSKVVWSPVVAKTRGRRKAGDTLPGVEVGASSTDKGDAGVAGADSPVRRSRRNTVNLGVGDGVERVAGAVSLNYSAKAEEEGDGVGQAVDRKRKRKTRENAEVADVSGQVGVSRRSTRSSGLLSGPAALSSPVIEKKIGRTKALGVQKHTSVEEQPSEVQDVGRSGIVVAGSILPIVAESKRSRRKVQDEEPAVLSYPVIEKTRGRRMALDVKEQTCVEEQPSEVQDLGRTLRSGWAVAGPVSPIVAESKRSRRNVQDEEPAAHKVAKVDISSRTTRSSSVAAAVMSPIVIENKRRKTEDVQSDGELPIVPEVPINDAPVTRVLRNRAVKSNDSVVEETQFGKKLENKRQPGRPSTRSRRHQHVASSVEASKSGVPTLLEQGAKGMHGSIRGQELQNAKDGDVEKQPTVKEPMRRSTRKSVVPAMLDKERKDLTTEIIPEAHVRRPTRKSVVPAMLEKERKSLTREVMPEAHARRSTRKSVVPAMLEKERKGIPAEMNPDAHVIVGRSTRKSIVPSMLNNEDSDHGEMQSAKVRNVEKQLGVEEPVKRLTRKSVVPAVFEKENKGLHNEMKSEAPARRSVRKSVAPNAVDKENKDRSEMVRTDESGVRMRNSRTRLQFAAQNDEGLRRTTRNSSKLVISQLQSKPIGSKRRPAKRRRTAALQEVMPVEEPNADDMVISAATQDVDKVTHGYTEVSSSCIQEIRQDNATGEESSSAPLLGTLFEETCRIQSVNEAMHELESGDCIYTSQQYNENEGLTKSSLEEQVASGQLGLLDAANCMEETNSEEVACKHEENKKPVHYINSSCEKSDANRPAEHASAISDALSRSSLIAPANDNDEVNLSSSLSRLESTGLLDEPVGCSNTEVVQQGLKEQCNEDKEDQVAYGTHTSDLIEVVTANDLESGVPPLQAEEKSVLRDAQLNSKLEGTKVVESGLGSDKDVSNITEFGSVVNGASKRSPSDSSLPEDPSVDHYQQQELINDLLADKSPEESAMCLENSDLGAGITENLPLDLAIPDCKHAVALSEEAVPLMKNDAGRCSPNLKQSPIGLQSLFSPGTTEGSYMHNATPSSECRLDETDVHKVERRVGKNISSEPDSWQGSDEDLIRVEENGGFMFSSQQNNEQEGFLKSSHGKDWVASAQLDSSEDVNHIVREIITKDVICKEEEKNEVIPSSESDGPHEKSHANEPVEHVCGVSEALLCNSQSIPIFDQVKLSSSSPQLESLDALDNRIAVFNTEVLHQDNKGECNVHYEGQVTQGIHGSGMSEAASIEGSESGKTLLPAVETSALPDEQLNSKLEGDEFEEYCLSCGKDNIDIFGAGSVKNNISHLAKECPMDSCHEQGLKLPNDLSAPKSPEESAICQDESVIGSGICQTIERRCTNEISIKDHKEEHNEHNEDQVTPVILASGMPEPALTEGSESGMTLLPTAETSALPDEQLNAKLDGNEEHSLSRDKESSNISDTGSVGNNNLSSLKDSDPCHDQDLPNDLSAPKSPDESTVCLDDSVSGSVGICETSGRRRVDEISTKLLSFKISSAVKGSYIAMDSPDSPRSVKHGDNLSQSATALLKNRENTPAAKTYPLKSSTDCSVLKDSSTPFQSISGRLKDVGLAADSPDNKLAMEQIQQDDVQVEEGTLEKTALGSTTPDCKHECGLPEEADLHLMKNESSSVEQSPLGLQSLFSQENIEEPMEYVALALARVQAENGAGESKDCHVEYRVEKTPLPETVSDHEIQVDFSVVSKNGDCACTSQQDNGEEGLTKASHKQEQAASGQIDFLEAANCMEDTNSEEVAYEDLESKKLVCSTAINSSCEKLDANRPVEHASAISDALLSSSMISPTDDNDKVHLSSNLYQLESADLLDEPLGCSNTEVLQHDLKEECDENKENQVAYGASTRDMIEADTAKDLESGVPPLPAEEKSNLPDEQLNMKLQGTEVVDHYQQEELLNDFSPEKSPEGSAMCWENSDLRAVPDTIDKPSFDLAISDYKHEGALSEEAVYSKKNDAERCSPHPNQSPIGLQFLFLEETMEGSDTHDALVLPSAETVDDSNTCPVELRIEKNVSSEPDSYQGSHEDLSRVKVNGGCMFSSQLDVEQEGFLNSSHKKDLVASAELDSSEDVNHMEREIITEEVICKEEEKREFISSSDIDTPLEKSHAAAEHASGVREALIYSSQRNPIFAEVNLSSNSSELESLDALDNHVVFSNTEVLNEDHREECNEYYEDQVSPGIDASVISEAAPIEGSESGIALLPSADMSAFQDEQLMMLLPDAEALALPDEQPYPELEGDEFEEHNRSCDKDTSYTFGAGSVKNNISPHVHKEEYNKHNEDQVTAGMLASGVSEPALIEGSESGMTLLPAAETSALPDEQLNPKLEGDKEHSLSFDKDTSNISDTGLVENNNLSSLPEDSYMDPRHEQELPVDKLAPKSPEESGIYLNDSVPGNMSN